MTITCKILPRLAQLYVWFVWITSKTTITVDEASHKLILDDKPVIISLWHNRILMMPKYMKELRSFTAVISAHRDGGLLEKFLGLYHHDAIRGSSRRGGFNAIKEVIKHLKNGEKIIITPDGPTGPQFVINGNITALAEKFSIPIVHICYSAKRAKILNTWDKFIIPWPFNNLAIDVSKPLYLDHTSSEADQKNCLRDSMLEQLNKLDQKSGLATTKKLNIRGIIAYNIYRFATFVLHPFLKIKLWRRMEIGKETLASIKQKMGQYTHPRPSGKLIWMHAASVGEAKSVLPIVNFITENHKISILITTSTITAAEFLRKPIATNDKVIHQFLVLDTPQNTRSFYNHWHPDLGIFIDSELWPNISKQSPCPLMLLNARISPRSFKRWKLVSWMFRFITDAFSVITPTTTQDTEFLKSLGVTTQIFHLGNLKNSAALLSYDHERYEKSKQALPGINFVCASTHEGEEIEILKEFLGVEVNLIIVPRHPNRGIDLVKIANKLGYEAILHSRCPIPSFKHNATPKAYIVDRIGDLGLWYRLADIVFIGGSLLDIGGHNIMEAAQLAKPIIVGPYTYNFTDNVKLLKQANAIIEVTTPGELKNELLSLIKSKPRRDKLANNAVKTSINIDNNITSSYVNLILKTMND